jgi:hypothetical protein
MLLASACQHDDDDDDDDALIRERTGSREYNGGNHIEVLELLHLELYRPLLHVPHDRAAVVHTADTLDVYSNTQSRIDQIAAPLNSLRVITYSSSIAPHKAMNSRSRTQGFRPGQRMKP